MTDETENTEQQYPIVSPGRPSRYSREIADEICRRLAQGESLRGICRDAHMPENNTVVNWAMTNKNGFFEQYAQARELQAWTYADEIMDIADDARNDYMEREVGEGALQVVANMEHIQRSRLRIDTRKWWVSKVLPRTFGDRLPTAAPMTSVTVNAGK